MTVKMLQTAPGNIHSVGYDEANRILHIRFAKEIKAEDGTKTYIPAKLYTYDDVPPEKFAGMIDANNVAIRAREDGKPAANTANRFFTSEIRNAGFTFRHVPEDDVQPQQGDSHVQQI